MTSMLYYFSLPIYWIFGIIYPVYQSYKAVELESTPMANIDTDNSIPKVKSNQQLSHWVNFWVVLNLFHILTCILEHGNPQGMPLFYILLKMGAMVYLSVSETDISGMILDSCVTPFFKPLVPEIDSALQDVSTEVCKQFKKLKDLAKSSTAAASKKNLPRKSSPGPN